MEDAMEQGGSNFLDTLAIARKKIEEALEYLNQLEKFSFVSTYKQATSDHVGSSSLLSSSISSHHFLNQHIRTSDFCSTPSTSPDESNRILNVPPILSNQQPPSIPTNVTFCNQVPQIIPYETRNLNAYQFSYQPTLYGQQMIIVCSSEKLIGNEINHELTPPLQPSAYELRCTPSGVEQTSTHSECSVHADDSASSGEFPVLSTLTSVSALQTFKTDLNDKDNQNTNYQIAVNAVAPQQVTSENNLEYSIESLPPTHQISQALHPVPTESILRNALLLSDVSQFPDNKVNDKNESTTSDEVAPTPSRTVALRAQKRLREKRFACSICNKKFAGSCDRKRHERIHTGEKPYRCDLCSMSFPREYGLRRHIRTHTGEKPYKCRFCGSGFADSGNRSIHERIHTGEKRFECRICHNKFRYSSERRTHEKKHIVEKTK